MSQNLKRTITLPSGERVIVGAVDRGGVLSDRARMRVPMMLTDGRVLDPALAELINDAASTGVSDDDIKQQVLSRRLGEDVVKGKSQAFLDAAWRVLTTPLDELNRPAQPPRAAPTPQEEQQRAQQAVIDAATGARDAARQHYVDTIRGAPRPDWLEPSANLADGQRQAADAYAKYCDQIANGWKN